MWLDGWSGCDKNTAMKKWLPVITASTSCCLLIVTYIWIINYIMNTVQHCHRGISALQLSQSGRYITTITALAVISCKFLAVSLAASNASTPDRQQSLAACTEYCSSVRQRPSAWCWSPSGLSSSGSDSTTVALQWHRSALCLSCCWNNHQTSKILHSYCCQTFVQICHCRCYLHK